MLVTIASWLGLERSSNNNLKMIQDQKKNFIINVAIMKIGQELPITLKDIRTLFKVLKPFI